MINQVTSSHEHPYWFGEIPPTWDVKRIKALFSLRDERNYLPLSEVNLISLYTNIGVVQHSDLTHTTGNRAQNADGYKIVKPDDIIVNILLCWMGAIGHCAYDGVTSPAYDIYTPYPGVNPRYYHYLFRTKLFSQQCYKAGKGIMAMRWRTYSPQFRNIKVPVPTLDEQNHIVNFLNWKISKINGLINNKKKQLSLLEQRKMAIVNHVLTGGIAGVKCKSSRIEGISAIPENWEEKALKWYVTSNDESLSGSTPDDYEMDYIDISTTGFRCLKKEPVHLTFDEAPSRARRIVRKGDTILSTVRTYLKAILYIEPEQDGYIVSTGFSVLRPKVGVYPQLLSFALSCNYFINAVIKNSVGVSYPAINDKKLLSLKLALPASYEEQVELYEYITQLTASTDSAINYMRDSIKGLQELKERIISDVVLGRTDIRRFEIPAYEYVDEEPDAVDSDEEAEELEDAE